MLSVSLTVQLWQSFSQLFCLCSIHVGCLLHLMHCLRGQGIPISSHKRCKTLPKKIHGNVHAEHEFCLSSFVNSGSHATKFCHCITMLLKKTFWIHTAVLTKMSSSLDIMMFFFSTLSHRHIVLNKMQKLLQVGRVPGSSKCFWFWSFRLHGCQNDTRAEHGPRLRVRKTFAQHLPCISPLP